MFVSKAMFRDYLHLHFIIFLWGFTALVGKWTSLGAMELVWHRTLIAIIGLLVLLRYRKIAGSKQAKHRWWLLATGGLVAAHWTFFFAAVQYSTVSICLVGLASTAFWTSILQPLFSRQPWRWYEMMFGGVILLGMFAVSQFESKYFLGLVMAMCSALCASSFTIINSYFTNKEHPLNITYYEMLGAFALVSLAMPIMSQLSGQELQLLPKAEYWFTDLLCLLFLALVCTVYAYAAAVELMKRISPFAINLSVNLEPVYGIAAAALLLKEYEQLTLEFYGSTALILICVLLYPAFVKRLEKKQQQPTVQDNMVEALVEASYSSAQKP
jgi:drug/metabolite transporter (DMT)-like permease